MKLKLDENIPVRVVEVLSELGHEVDTVPSQGLTGRMTNAFGKQPRTQNDL